MSKMKFAQQMLASYTVQLASYILTFLQNFILTFLTSIVIVLQFLRFRIIPKVIFYMRLASQLVTQFSKTSSHTTT